MALVCSLTATAIAQQAAGGDIDRPVAGDFRAGEAFTFLFLAMGPFPIIPGFAAITAGRDRRFKLGLAFYGIAVAAAALFIAATTGMGALAGWHVSIPALALATGLILLLAALIPLLEVYSPRPKPPAPAPDAPLPTRTDLAFSPLAFPIIIPPFGMAIVILLLALAQERGATATLAWLILLILVLDLLAMIFADLIMRMSWLKYALHILGTVMRVLQVALAMQIIAGGIQDLNLL